MTRIFGHYIPLEMLLLWLAELAICFTLGYVLIDAGADASAGHAMNRIAADEAAVLALSAGLTSFAIGLYRPETFLRLRRLLVKTAIAGILSFPAIWITARIAGIDLGLLLGQGALLPLKVLAAWICIILAIRLSFSYSLRMNLFTRRVALIATDAMDDTVTALRTGRAVQHLRSGLFETVGSPIRFDPTQDRPEALIEQLRRRRVWGAVVVTTGAQAGAIEQAMSRAQPAGRAAIRVMRSPCFWENQLRRVDIDQLTTVPQDFAAAAAAGGRVQNAIRRVTDILLSIGLLLFTLPLMLVTALAIRLDSPGPVFYRQERVGLHGRLFTLCKFRSMRTDAEAKGPVWAAQKDNRVTRVGAFIRRTRIDELPQLMNVLRGEMSFIGPRPERPHFVDQLAAQIPFYRERAHVKPGLTGWAQVNYPYGASVEDARMKLSYDLYYLKRCSLFLDVLILFATVRVILFQEGAR